MSRSAVTFLIFPAVAGLVLASPASADGPPAPAPGPAEHTLASQSSANLTSAGLSGTIEAPGNRVTWTVSGATPPTPGAYEAYIDGVVPLGATVSFSGTVAYLGGTGATRLLQAAYLNGVPQFEVQEDINSQPVSRTFNISAVTTTVKKEYEAGQQVGQVSLSAKSMSCIGLNYCREASVNVNLAVVATQTLTLPKAQPTPDTDTEAPSISLKSKNKIFVEKKEKEAKNDSALARFPIKLNYAVNDNSGKSKIMLGLFSGGKIVGKQDGKWFKNGGHVRLLKDTPPGPGPFYWCVQAVDKAGNKSTRCEWLAIAVPWSRADVNGCGTGKYGPAVEWAQNYFGDNRTFNEGTGMEKMSVREACNNHDAGYAGITTFDPIHDVYVDYRPMSRLKIDEKFKEDIQTLCRKKIDLDANLAVCLGGLGLEEFKKAVRENPVGGLRKAGATTYFDIVRSGGQVAYDADSAVPGDQTTAGNYVFIAGAGRNNA